MDRLTPEQRSAHMARIRGKDTQPELAVRRLLHRLGYRFRLHRRSLPGTPDIVLPTRRKVVFVNGCFWHGHKTCKVGGIPKTRTTFWTEKLVRNRRRDAQKVKALRAAGWSVAIVWECQTRPSKLDGLERRLRRFLGAPGTGSPKREPGA